MLRYYRYYMLCESFSQLTRSPPIFYSCLKALRDQQMRANALLAQKDHGRRCADAIIYSMDIVEVSASILPLHFMRILLTIGLAPSPNIYRVQSGS